MNKLMIIPLAIMIVLTMIAFLMHGTTGTINQGIGPAQEIGVGNSTLSTPGVGDQEIDIWQTSAGGALAVLITALAVGIIAGVKVLGSGLTDTSQIMIFKMIGVVGLWTVLSMAGGSYIMSDAGTLGVATYILLTLMFALGFVMDLSTAGASSGE